MGFCSRGSLDGTEIADKRVHRRVIVGLRELCSVPTITGRISIR
jgi:hypothetical protein